MYYYALMDLTLKRVPSIRLVLAHKFPHPTINVPKSKSPLATKDINIQTEPISDKGFGVSYNFRYFFFCNKMDF